MVMARLLLALLPAVMRAVLAAALAVPAVAMAAAAAAVTTAQQQRPNRRQRRVSAMAALSVNVNVIYSVLLLNIFFSLASNAKRGLSKSNRKPKISNLTHTHTHR